MQRLSSRSTWVARNVAPHVYALLAIGCFYYSISAFREDSPEAIPLLLLGVAVALVALSAWRQAPYLWDAERDGGELRFWRGSVSFTVSAATVTLVRWMPLNPWVAQLHFDPATQAGPEVRFVIAGRKRRRKWRHQWALSEVKEARKEALTRGASSPISSGN